MKLVADESIDQPIVERLRADGHEVVAILEAGPGLPDDEVLAVAESEDALLLTADKDFGDLVYRQRRINSGVLLIRLAGLTAARKSELASALLESHGVELQGAFTVLSPGSVRIRKGAT
jgi:predicted nuclease of predicted toxin-antitoxin system